MLIDVILALIGTFFKFLEVTFGLGNKACFVTCTSYICRIGVVFRSSAGERELDFLKNPVYGKSFCFFLENNTLCLGSI